MTTRNNGKNGGAGDHSWGSARSAKRFSSLRDLSVTYEGHSEDVVTRPPDISTRGMFINTTRVFPEGAVLNVRFRLAISGHEVRSRAEVRYCLPGVGVGVEFIDILPEDVRAIEREIENRTEAGKK
ncbi:MAG TPA: PilZ domain-containing protein [Candidatus Acidoferrales bacterium]|nr:PilZ domain-containing protein [Candidatus Acidoferrales bacterium]